MTPSDQERLAQIRADSLAWQAEDKEANNWNDGFLIRLLDEEFEKTRALYELLIAMNLVEVKK